jgi:hypothetical protein
MQDKVFLIGISISILISILIAVFLLFMVLGERFKAAEERAHARRIADARMNARLLRLNL